MSNLSIKFHNDYPGSQARAWEPEKTAEMRPGLKPQVSGRDADINFGEGVRGNALLQKGVSPEYSLPTVSPQTR